MYTEYKNGITNELVGSLWLARKSKRNIKECNGIYIWTEYEQNWKFTEIKTFAGANQTDQKRGEKTTSVWIVSSFPMFYCITEKNQAKFFLFPHFLITNNYASYNKDPCKLISLVNCVPLFCHRADGRTDGRTDGRYTGERASSTLLTGKTKRNRWRGKNHLIT